MSVRPVPKELLPWAADVLACNASDLSVASVAGDASNRHYYRLFAGAALQPTFERAVALVALQQGNAFFALGILAVASKATEAFGKYIVDRIHGFFP